MTLPNIPHPELMERARLETILETLMACKGTYAGRHGCENCQQQARDVLAALKASVQERERLRGRASEMTNAWSEADKVVEVARNIAGLRIGAWPELADALAEYDAALSPSTPEENDDEQI